MASFITGGNYVHTLLMLFLAILYINKIKKLKSIVETYTWLFENRKNPVIYRDIKNICKIIFKAREKSEIKKLFYISLAALFIIVLNLIWFIYIGTFKYLIWALFFTWDILDLVLMSYINCIFDFDPPKKKRKKKKAKVTDLQKKRWSDMFKQPQALPKPV